MEYVEIPYKMHYYEDYLPTKRHKNPRKHIVEEDAVVKIPVVDDLPAACIINGYDGKNDEKIGYAFGGFWRIDPECTKERLEEDLGYKYSSATPDKGSPEDVEQGWTPDAIHVRDKKAENIAEKEFVEKTHLVHEGKFWRKVDEPFYRISFSIGLGYIAAGVTAVWWEKDDEKNPPSRRIDRFAYALKDSAVMRENIHRNAHLYNRTRKINVIVHDARILMPEVFHFGEEAEQVIDEHAYEYLPASLRRELEFIGASKEEPSEFMEYVKDMLGSYIIAQMKKDNEPCYRVSEFQAKLALEQLLEDMTAIARRAESML